MNKLSGADVSQRGQSDCHLDCTSSPWGVHQQVIMGLPVSQRCDPCVHRDGTLLLMHRGQQRYT